MKVARDRQELVVRALAADQHIPTLPDSGHRAIKMQLLTPTN